MIAQAGKSSARRRRTRLTPERISVFVLFALGSLLVLALAHTPDYGRSIVRGPMTPGHETVPCLQCHAIAPGTMRQQAQANVWYWIGLRKTPAAFGHQPVSSASCIGCHSRANDRHPTFRFREPRFFTVNQTLDAKSCLSCHAEHGGRRVSSNAEFCQLCHSNLNPRIDPIKPAHAELVKAERWNTCLGCHDFHGNHPVKAPTVIEEAHDLAAVLSYLGNGPDPYSQTKIHKAKQP